MSFEIGKTFRFEAAHCLEHHDGKCARPHGHSYEFELIAEGLDVELEGPKAGMVADYDEISTVGNWIADQLDHRDLNEALDSDTVTAEELARLVCEMAFPRLPGLVEVRFKETAKTFASYRPRRAAERRALQMIELLMMETKERLYHRIDTSDPDACWPFAGAKDADGYGWFSFAPAKTRKAHRASAWLAGDDIEGMVVLHLCDNPSCVNPGHLRVGTHLDNENDKDAKDRRPRGEGHGGVKLSESNVREIVALVKAKEPRRVIAKKFGVSTALIDAIVAGRVWRHVVAK